MGWLSRNKRPSGASTGVVGEEPAGDPASASPGMTSPAPADPPVSRSGSTASGPPMGRYGPLVSITAFEEGAEELSWQVPVNGQLYRLVPGPDRPDYSIMVLERALHFYPAPSFDVDRVPPEQRVADRKGRPMVRVDALVLCARFVGQQLHAGMKDLVVNIAHVLDPSVLTDPTIDLTKIEYAAIGRMSEGHVGRPDAAAAGEEPDAAEPLAGDVAEVFRHVAQLLRQGIAEHRGRPVERREATLTLDENDRLAGLSGLADGAPPVPTAETFERVNEVLATLQDRAPAPSTRQVTVRVEPGAEEIQVQPLSSSQSDPAGQP
jgi:hypothetical protein